MTIVLHNHSSSLASPLRLDCFLPALFNFNIHFHSNFRVLFLPQLFKIGVTCAAAVMWRVNDLPSPALSPTTSFITTLTRVLASKFKSGPAYLAHLQPCYRRSLVYCLVKNTLPPEMFFRLFKVQILLFFQKFLGL